MNISLDNSAHHTAIFLRYGLLISSISLVTLDISQALDNILDHQNIETSSGKN